jgi:hypothetical protein
VKGIWCAGCTPQEDRTPDGARRARESFRAAGLPTTYNDWLSAKKTRPRGRSYYFENGMAPTPPPSLNYVWRIGNIRYNEFVPRHSPGIRGKRIIYFLHFSTTGSICVNGDDAVSYVGSSKIVEKSECGTLEGRKRPSLL